MLNNHRTGMFDAGRGEKPLEARFSKSTFLKTWVSAGIRVSKYNYPIIRRA
jgi:hypothetical protein